MQQSHGEIDPHVLLFPFPAKGHIKPFLCLAQLLCSAGLRVTFLNTDHNHRRIDGLDLLSGRFPSLHFETISDGLPPDEPRDVFGEKFYISILTVTEPLFREFLVSYNNGSGSNSGGRPPISCLITDVIFRFPMDAAEELGIPVISFCTFSARYMSLYFWIPELIQNGQLPFPADGNMNQELHGAPVEAEGVLRRKDLPGYMAFANEIRDEQTIFVHQTLASSRSSGLILNTFDTLETPFVSHLSKIFNKIYTIGPIHSLLNNSHCGQDDTGCLAWLDSQPPRSVVFVSFGSVVKATSCELMELWHGLVNSGKSFLLVLRSDAVEGEDEKNVVNEILDTHAEGKWMVVEWAPQEQVLAHQAIGGFLTHSGWNSILESIVSRVPMISCPKIADQFSTCTWISQVWKIGLEMEDRYDRSTVETMVRSLMEQDGEKMHRMILDLAERAKFEVSRDGMSYRNLKILIDDIRKIKPD